MLYYITENKNKVDVAKKFLFPFGINFTAKKLDISELQSESWEEIVKDKARKAFSILQMPLIVTDHFWSIPSLGGFPGAYMKYINKWLTAEDILVMMANKTDRSISLTEALCYVDGKTLKTFSYNHPGIILNKPQGKGIPGQTIVSLTRDGMSIARKLESDASVLEENKLWVQFAKWYLNN